MTNSFSYNVWYDQFQLFFCNYLKDILLAFFKTLNFILISGIICQERVLQGHTLVKCNISKGPFSLNKTK